MDKKARIFNRICFAIFVIGLVADTALMGLFEWFSASFGVTFREIIYTMKSPLAGANNDFFSGAVRYVAPKLAAFIIILAVGVFVFFVVGRYVSTDIIWDRTKGSEKKIDALKLIKALLFIATVGYSFYVIYSINDRLEISSFIRDYNSGTEIYDEYYVKPDVEAITCDRPKNLIYIYMESMETTYASKEVGGEQPEINYIPNLTALADENVSFSDEDGLGGFISAKNT
ncbi:MAG: hypothetical protein J5367_08195, partial [Lachnospiraceae bacterium]|nr:hypothetical protein [Lachnospiraceae bacterium]